MHNIHAGACYADAVLSLSSSGSSQDGDGFDPVSSGRGWAPQGLRGPWSQTQKHLGAASAAHQPGEAAQSSSSSLYSLGLTGEKAVMPQCKVQDRHNGDLFWQCYLPFRQN